METRANYVLIGAFTLAGILASLGFFVWLARLQINQQFAYYDILFDNVSGLSRAAEVRLNGLAVGQVLSLNLYDQDPSKIRVRIELAAETPVREDTRAQLQSQGVTGVSYVALSGGSPDAPLLRDSVQGVPTIFGERSVVEQLTQDAPDLLTEAMALVRSLQQFVSADNRAYVTGILRNLDTASTQLGTALSDFSSITGTVAKATEQIGAFTGRLDQIGSSVETTLGSLDTTLQAAREAMAKAETTLAAATGAFSSAERTIADVDGVIHDSLPKIVDDASATIANLRAAVAPIEKEARAVLGQFGSAAGQADSRLAELKTTIEELDTTLAAARTTLQAIDLASYSFATLVDGDGTALVAEARATLTDASAAISSINQAVAEDVPAIMADVRNAVETANRVIDQAGTDVTGFTGSLEPLSTKAGASLDAATTTLQDASATLARLDVAMGAAERTLVAAEETFTVANRIIDEEVAPTAADIRTAAAELGSAVSQVSADLPQVTGDLRDTLDRADRAIGSIEAVVAASGPPVRDFATTGLPQFTRFTIEARGLIERLDRIADRLERDPARLLLGNQAPTYRR